MDVAGSAVGIISLGLTVCQSLLAYYQSWKDSNEDVTKIYNSIESLESILKVLEDIIGRKIVNQNIATSLQDSLIRCRSGIDALDKKLKKIRSSESPHGFQKQAKAQLMRISYPFKQSTLFKLRNIIENEKMSLSSVLNALQIHTSSITFNEVTDSNKKLDEMSLVIAKLGLDMTSMKLTIGSSAFDQQREKILGWLCNVDPSTNRRAACEKHEPTTGSWFLSGLEFEKWKTTNLILWLNGNMGRGKTVLCSEDVKRYCTSQPKSAWAYFYFSSADIQKQTALACLSSLARQLSKDRPISQSLQQSYDQHNKEQSNVPTIDSVKVALGSIIEGFSQVFIIIDA